MASIYEGINEEFVTAGGMTWRMGVTGPEDGAPVVLLHGFPEYWRTWTKVMPALAGEGYKVYAPDLPGYGGTDEPASYDLAELASSVADLLRRIDEDGVHLIGHDWGGITGHAVAYVHPETVKSYVAACAPHPASFGSGRRDPRQLVRSWYIGAFQIPMIEQAIGHKAFIEKAAAGCRTEIDSPEKMRRALAFYRANLKPWLPLKLRVGNITQPGMVIHAQKDVAITSQIMEVTARQFDDLREYVALPCPHFLHNQCPDQLNSALLRFLREVA